MELSKKVGYIKGLMAGLKIDDSTPTGQVLCAMSDLLEEIAEEVEINSQIIDNVTDYIDGLEEDLGSLDDIYAEESDFDPFEDIEEYEDMEESDELEELDAVSDELEELAAAEQEIDDDLVEEQETESEEAFEPAEQSADEEDTDESEAAEVAPEPEPEFAPEPEFVPEEAPAAPPVQDEVLYECPCPICGVTFQINQEELNRGTTRCPNCGELLEFES